MIKELIFKKQTWNNSDNYLAFLSILTIFPSIWSQNGTPTEHTQSAFKKKKKKELF